MAEEVVRVIAHRGWSAKAPENTLPAFEAAIEGGADGIELDVQLSRDGRVVVCHDETLDRTTDGSGPLAERTLPEIEQLDAGSWFSPEFAGTRVPTLSAVLELIRRRGWAGLINVELKTDKYPYPGIEERVAEELVRYGAVDRTIVSSFNRESLVRMQAALPGVAIGFLYGQRLRRPWELARAAGCRALHPAYACVDAETVREAHRRGLEVNVWTVNDGALARRLAEAGVDGIITDRPDVIAAGLRGDRPA